MTIRLYEKNPAKKIKKIKKLRQNSIGNRHRLSQQSQYNDIYCLDVNSKEDVGIVSKKKLSDAEIFQSLLKLKKCGCSRGLEHNGEYGCALLAFREKNLHDGTDSVNFNKACALFRDCRSQTFHKTKIELDRFIQDKFKESIAEIKLSDDNKEVAYVMDYSINGIKVCKKSFAAFYGVSVKYLERCSKTLKQSDFRRVYSTSHRTFTDDHIHNYTYAETDVLMQTNAPDSGNFSGTK
jgi:hypothetical protein